MNFTLLAQIQELDKRLMELAAEKGDLPEKVAQLKTEMETLTTENKEKKSALENTRKELLQNKNETERLEDLLNKNQEKIYHVKTNKEYDAITSEIEILEKKIDEAETAALELMEREQTLTSEIEELEKKIAEVQERLAANEKELNEKMAKTEAEERILNHERDLLIAKLDRRLISQYERIRRAKEGIAIAVVDHYTCSGCFATIPAQTVLEIRKRERIIVCETCGRILITPEIEEKAVSELHLLDHH